MNNSCFPLCLCKFVSFVEGKQCKKTHQMNIKIKVRCWRWNNNNNKETRESVITIKLMEWKNEKQKFSLRHIISIQKTFRYIVFPHQNYWILWWICVANLWSLTIKIKKNPVCGCCCFPLNFWIIFTSRKSSITYWFSVNHLLNISGMLKKVENTEGNANLWTNFSICKFILN